MSSKFMHGSSILLGDNTVPGVQLSPELKEHIPTILKACRDWGLDFYPTVVQVLTYDEISENCRLRRLSVRISPLAMGHGVRRTPAWVQYGMHKIYEMVINTNPCYIWNLSSNSLLDHLTVVAHATGHNDFFKNNIHFSATDTNMLNKMANHGTRIRRYMTRWGKERVIEFIDHVLRIETLIDGSKAWNQKIIRDRTLVDQRKYRQPRRLKVERQRLYMEPFINTKQFRQEENERIAKADTGG
jgi:stage V sporulation protein R